MTGVSAIRNTCFAILSAIETDLREIIADFSLSEGTSEILPPDVRENALQRFEQDKKNRPGVVPDDLDLLDYTDFADLGKMLRKRLEEVTLLAGKDVTEIANKIEDLAPARNRVCHSRPLDDEDLPRFLDFSKSLVANFPALHWRELRDVQNKIDSDPSYIFRLVIPGFWRTEAERVAHNLPLPDFDETGFLGRTTEKRDLLKHLLGPHPLISVVGEGGVGKTALALRCLYDLLDAAQDNPPFEAIVWISLKSKVLTPAGIQDIRNAITSTLGMIQAVSQILGSTSSSVDTESLISELRGYMEKLPILLVIDNFETLTGDSLRSLLVAIPKQSKILITSRLGLGELELRYKLDPLDKKTAESLMRRYAKVLNVQLLLSTPEKRIERYCKAVYHNPLLIKWFVSSVATGEDPEKLAARTGSTFEAAIKFCFENLFSRLSDAEKLILHVLAAARRPLSHAELYFIIEEAASLKQQDVERSLAILYNSSMLKRTLADARRADSGVQVGITDVAADYIARFAPPPSKLFERVQSCLKKLRTLAERSAVMQATYKYDLFAIRANSPDERIAGAFLNSALVSLQKSNFAEARQMVERARLLLPTYSEVYRISALLETKAGDLYKAAQENETAVALSKTALPHFQNALFYLHDLDDSQAALNETDAALSLDPGDETLETIRALCLTRVGRYKEAAEIYEKAFAGLDERPRKWRITTRDQAAECYRRWAEQDHSLKDDDGERQHMARAFAILDEALAKGDFDKRTAALYCTLVEDSLFAALRSADLDYATEALSRAHDASFLLALPEFRRLTWTQFSGFFMGKTELMGLAETLTSTGSIRWHVDAGGRSSAGALESEEEFFGTIKTMVPKENFGFITDISGVDWFFHRNMLSEGKHWDSLKGGEKVKFKLGFNKSGKCALDVHVLDEGK